MTHPPLIARVFGGNEVDFVVMATYTREKEI